MTRFAPVAAFHLLLQSRLFSAFASQCPKERHAGRLQPLEDGGKDVDALLFAIHRRGTESSAGGELARDPAFSLWQGSQVADSGPEPEPAR